MKARIKNEIKNNIKYIYATVLISFLTILPQLVVTDSMGRFIADILLFILLIAISKYSKIIFSIFIVYLNIINIFLIHVKIHWGSDFSAMDDRIRQAARSPYYEMLEYLNTYINYKDYLFIAYTFFILILLYRLMIYFRKKYKILKIIGVFTSIVLILILGYREPFVVVQRFIQDRYDTQFLLYRKEFLSSTKKQYTDIEPNNINYDKVIIIQGESVNKHHMQIYGYDKNTTPFFNELLKSGKLHLFNAIAPSNVTAFSVPMIFTKANVVDWKNMFIHSQSLVSDFKDFAYDTYWISNQAVTYDGNITNNVNANVNSIALEANNKIFFNQDFNEVKTDIVIVNYLDRLKYNTNKEMYVFHLIGSHEKYKRRVIKNYSLYENPKNIIEEYDNTIYFTDYIIQNIFKYFFKGHQKILIVYVSDHGEVVNKNKNGHGFLPPFKDEHEVPLLIYSNIQNERIDLLMEKNEKHYFNMENLNYIIKYISGITEDLNISYSSHIYAVKLKNMRDYDQLKHFQPPHEDNKRH